MSSEPRLTNAERCADPRITRKTVEYLRENRSPLKSWFKAKEIAPQIDEPTRRVGVCLSALYHDPDSPIDLERRSATGSYAYYVPPEDPS